MNKKIKKILIIVSLIYLIINFISYILSMQSLFYINKNNSAKLLGNLVRIILDSFFMFGIPSYIMFEYLKKKK